MSIVLQPHAEERLRSDKMMWLITVRADGRPHAVPVWFFWDGATVLIFSKPNNQKIRNLRQNHHVTLALDDTKNGGDVMVLDGTAELLEREIGNTILEAYGEKYRKGLARMSVTVEQFTALYSQLIRVTPVHLLAWP